MELYMEINNVKSIRNLKFVFPLDKGLYAITGENASGKSTLVACASSVFFQLPMYESLGLPEENAAINFRLDDTTRSWNSDNGKWKRSISTSKMNLNGFYEGSIIFGNRFKDTNVNNIKKLDSIDNDSIIPANDFVRKNLGLILHNNSNYYKELFVLKRAVAKKNNLSSATYFYKTNNKFINQQRMSTGENLLISILHSLNIVRNKRINHNDGRPCLVLLDEIELALHASALRRLVHFLTEVSNECDLAIFFSTHSLELIRGIRPQNIYYLERQLDNTVSVINPCYPAYATRNLYSDDGYGDDMVILVEDDIAKNIIERVLLEKDLLNNIRIKVLPTGGWTNTITMAFDIISSGLLLKGTKIAIVLDFDIKNDVPKFLNTHKQYRFLQLDYLPISSLEKYLKEKLINNVDMALYKKLNNYIFQKRPLKSIIDTYASENDITEDKTGKTFYGYLLNELRSMRKEREDLVEIVMKHVFEQETELVDSLTNYLKRKIEE